MLYGKIVDGNIITTYAPEDDTDALDLIVADGFKPYHSETEPPELKAFEGLKSVYMEKDGEIFHYWDIVENDREKIEAEIHRLENELAQSDYQIIKSYEYALVGEPTFYDLHYLHEKREKIRRRIRELE